MNQSPTFFKEPLTCILLKLNNPEFFLSIAKALVKSCLYKTLEFIFKHLHSKPLAIRGCVNQVFEFQRDMRTA